METVSRALDAGAQKVDDDTKPDEPLAFDSTMFAALYEHHLSGIYSYVRARTSNDEIAIDITHQVFQKALEALPRYQHQGVPPHAWLYRIARNAVIDFHRRPRPNMPWDSLAGVLQLSDGDEVEERVLQRERAELLHRLLRDVDEDKLEILVLRFAGGLRVREVAAILGRSEAAVKSELRRILRGLRERYDDN